MGRNLLTYDSLVLATAGATGSVTAQLVTMPLTTAYTRMQLEEGRENIGPLEILTKLYKEEGLLTLYRGCKSTLQSVAISNFIYFYTFHGLKNITGVKEQSPLKDLVFASLAGCVNVMITNPLWVVNVRLKMAGINSGTPRYKGLLDGLLKIGREEGSQALWSGAKASLLLVSNPAIKFTVYELLKRRIVKGDRGQVVGVSAFMLGAAATAVATVITYPLQVVQARARHGVMEHGRRIANLKAIITYIIKKDGIGGIFKGLDSKLVQSMVAAGFMFLTYEKIAAFVFAILGAPRQKQ